MAEIEKNNKYLDLGGLEYFKNNYIQNVYIVTATSMTDWVNESDQSLNEYTIKDNISILSNSNKKTTYTFSGAKIGDILIYQQTKTPFVVTQVNQQAVNIMKLSARGLESITEYNIVDNANNTTEEGLQFNFSDGQYYRYAFSNLKAAELINPDNSLDTFSYTDAINVRDQVNDLEANAVITEDTLTTNKIVVGNGNKTVKISDYTVTDIVNIAEGKTKSYVISTELETIEGFINGNISFKTNDDTLTIDKTLPEGTTKLQDNADNIIDLSDLKVGDLILVLEADYPDRWVSEVSSNFVAFTIVETEKIDLTPYLKKPIGQSPVNDEAILTYSSALDRTAILYTIAEDNWTSGSNSKIPTTAQVINWATGAFDSPAEVTNKITTALASYLTTEDANNTYVPIKTVVAGTEKNIKIQSLNQNAMFGNVFSIRYGHTELGVLGDTAEIGIADDSNKAYLGTTWHTNHTINFESYGAETLTSSASINRIKIGPKTFTRQHEITGTEYEILDCSMSITTSEIDELFNSSQS